ncbi:MAG: hypothetical protein F6K11_34605 [Leptolyngbya sp. SIO3F4]|nr:hypothetical protein [Leptolyngbya sp. SIO3F4]
MPLNFNSLSFKSCCQLLYGLVTAGMFLLLPSVPAWAQSEDCSFFASPQRFNTFEGEDDRIIIGQFRGRPYVVLSVHYAQENFSVIRACVPDAFLTSSRLGGYIHIASFDNYRDAKALAKRIDEFLDIDVRVMHYSRLGR